MKKGTPRHPKMILLGELLDESLEGAISENFDPATVATGIMEKLWHHAAEFALDGNLTSAHSRRQNSAAAGSRHVAQSCGWKKDPQILVDSLVEAGWLDIAEDGSLHIHDWAENCEDSVHARLARAGKLFADRSMPKLNKLDALQREKAKENYPKTETKKASGGKRPPTAAAGEKRRKTAAYQGQGQGHSQGREGEESPVPPLAHSAALEPTPCDSRAFPSGSELSTDPLERILSLIEIKAGTGIPANRGKLHDGRRNAISVQLEDYQPEALEAAVRWMLTDESEDARDMFNAIRKWPDALMPHEGGANRVEEALRLMDWEDEPPKRAGNYAGRTDEEEFPLQFDALVRSHVAFLADWSGHPERLPEFTAVVEAYAKPKLLTGLTEVTPILEHIMRSRETPELAAIRENPDLFNLAYLSKVEVA